MSISNNHIKPIHDNKTLSTQAFEYLIGLIKQGVYLPGQKFPSEYEVAESLNISRTSLREAFHRLELEGYITRKRGIGTFVIGLNPLQLDEGLEKLYSDSDIISSRGGKISTAEIAIRQSISDKDTSGKLQILEGEPVTIVDRLRMIDNNPYCWDSNIFPSKYLPASTDPETIGLSLFKYATEKLGLEISHAVTYLSPVLCDKFLSQKLGISIGSPMMHWKQVHYVKGNAPVWISLIWYPEHVSRWHIVRTR